MRKFKLCAVALCATLSLVACGDKKDNQTTTQTQKVTQTQTQTQTQTKDPHAGMVRSDLTGEWIDKSLEKQVPLACMISNIYDATPQSSIDKADIVMEAYAEGGITRLMCIYKDWRNLAKIGPVRSCRLYYLQTAKEFEATYVHFGYSEYAESALFDPSNHSLDGMVYCDFYRSDDRIAPHNAYTTGVGILDAVKYRDYPETLPADYVAPFKFTTDDKNEVELTGGMECTRFEPGYLYNNPYFTYDSTTKLYKRFQFEDPHVDMESGKQLEFKNIVVKMVDGVYWENGTPNYDLCGSGRGYYITNGKAVPIKWEKSYNGGPTQYYYEDGRSVMMNVGKTYFCLVEYESEGVLNIN